MGRASRPIILLAFADPRRDLANLKRETSGLRRVFRHSDQCELLILDHPSLGEIEDAFQEYRNQIVAFHYGGHADGFRQLLESETGEVQNIDARGLAEFLASQPTLRFVFLNGCSTGPQVEAFFQAGVPCVIATTREINDQLATEFSLRFYKGLDEGIDIESAYNQSVGSAKSRDGSATRGATFGNQVGSAEESEFPWVLHKQDDSAGQWTLANEFADRRQRRSPGNSASQRLLQELLKQVDEFWVDGVFERNAPEASALHLSKESRPDIINNPLEAVVEYSGDDRQVIEPGTSIVDVYDQSRSRLLITGQPGAGKTTTLLELTKSLVERAHRDPTYPVPVVLNLSTWKDEQQTLADWLQNELREKYHVPISQTPQWLTNQELILLLDGLDECRESLRPDCVREIHEFLDSTGAHGIVVTCRSREYSKLPEQLSFGDAVHLRPLTKEQIIEFVSAGGEKLSELKRVLQSNNELLELAQSPLLLNIMCQAYADSDQDDDHDDSTESLTTDDDPKAAQADLFNRFINRMFRRRGRLDPPFEREETEGWLGWIARKTDEDHSSMFMFEKMQPKWLEQKNHKLMYAGLASLALALIMGLASAFFWWCAAQVSASTNDSIARGLLLWPFPLLTIWFAIVCLIDLYLPNFAARGDESFQKSTKQAVLKFAIYFGVWMLLCCIPTFMQSNWKFFEPRLTSIGVCGSLLMAAAGRRQRTMLDIRSVYNVGWSTNAALKGAGFGLLGGLLLHLNYWMSWEGEPNLHFFWQSKDAARRGYEFVMLCFLSGGAVAGAVLGGLVPRYSEVTNQPNQGMISSRRNAVKVGAVSGAAFFITLICLFSLLRRGGLNAAGEAWSFTHFFLFSLGSGVLAAVSAGMIFGGFDWTKHYILRFVLVVTGLMPRQLRYLMKYATQLNFMQPVGGGFLFIHRLLQQHFAKTKMETGQDKQD